MSDRHESMTLEKAVLYILIPLQLLIFTFLVPPFQKPDEYAHFTKTLLISRGHLFCTKTSDNTVQLERKYMSLIGLSYLRELPHRASVKVPLDQYRQDLLQRDKDGAMSHVNIDHLCSFPAISYLPQAASLAITDFLNLPTSVSFFIGRFVMGIIGYLWFLYLYRRINPQFSLIPLFVFALPMTLHQISSYNYDAIHILLGLSFFTYLTTLMTRKRVGDRDLVKLFAILLLFLTSKKIGYEFFLLFVFLIPREKISRSTKEYAAKMLGMMAALVLFVGLLKLPAVHDLGLPLDNPRANPTAQMQYILQEPLAFSKVLVMTTLDKIDVYIQGLIGLFGWLEYGLDPLSYFLYGLFFLYVIRSSILPKSERLDRRRRGILFVILAIQYAFILTLSYLFWTAPGERIVDGVQGRYFTTLVPFAMLFLIDLLPSPKKEIKLHWSIFGVAVVYLLYATLTSIFARYY